MRRARAGAWALLLSVAVTLPLQASAPSLFDFDDWMQRIDDGNQELQRRIAAQDRDAAVSHAREIEDLYGRMEQFFEQRGTGEPAVRMSREARELAAGAVRHLGRNNFDAARANALRIAHGCRACHIEYKPL